MGRRLVGANGKVKPDIDDRRRHSVDGYCGAVKKGYVMSSLDSRHNVRPHDGTAARMRHIGRTGTIAGHLLAAIVFGLAERVIRHKARNLRRNRHHESHAEDQ